MATSAGRRDPSLKLLRPLIRAYILGYLSVAGPKSLSLIPILRQKGHGKDDALVRKLSQIFLGPVGLNRFPTFCAVLVGGSTLLQVPLRQLFILLGAFVNKREWRTPTLERERFIRFLASSVSAWFSFRLLNRGRTERIRRNSAARHSDDIVRHHRASQEVEAQQASSGGRSRVVLVGRTMDLTLFGVTRAVDICVGEAWSRRAIRRRVAGKWTVVESLISNLADAGVFAVSSSIIMWAWFYLPERLPRSYNNWIGQAAQVDFRLIEALRRARRGEWVYGKDTGQARVLQDMCKDYGWPLDWGDPAKTCPIPCEMVHMRDGPSCEIHALSRFLRAFRFALATYIPLQLLIRLRAPSKSNAVAGLKDAARSSAFLGSFISIFYYSVCLARTRLGPKLFNHQTVTPMMWDSGLCVAAGCMMCGWSILIEKAKRRQEIAFFVAPRAAATLLPRRYEQKYQIREQIAFALSAAVIFTCVQERPERVRGVLGRILNRVLA